jgi:L-ascorbate metabolism protein UlaG (beta-lactamase superfamily)
MRSRVALALLAGLALLAWRAPGRAASADAAPVLEYIAHASFAVQSSTGTRVVVDPYNSERWLGYTFPSGVAADAVLVTHPHYDHDASYYFPAGTPVLRRPGRYAVGDIAIEGFRGRHADPYGRDFGQVNTVWVVETGGVRIAHLGDNGPPAPELLTALGRIDVLLVPDDAQKHILDDEAIAHLRRRLQPTLVVPMHYRLPGFRDLPSSLGPVQIPGAESLATHRLVLDRDALARAGRTVVMQPSPGVTAWSQPLADAWSLRDAGRPPATAGPPTPDAAQVRRSVDALRKAAALVPSVIVFQGELAEGLHALGQDDEAVAILERALAAADQQDVEYTMKARALLAGIYARRGRHALAAAQYRIVAAGSSRIAQVEEAHAFLLTFPGR